MINLIINIFLVIICCFLYYKVIYIPIKGKRHLKATWSIEQSQELMNMYGFNVEEELIDALSYEINNSKCKGQCYEN